MSQITELHDDALRGIQRTERNFMFKGVRLNAETKSDGLVYFWFADADEDIDNQFDSRELDEDEFVDEVGNWVVENR